MIRCVLLALALPVVIPGCSGLPDTMSPDAAQTAPSSQHNPSENTTAELSLEGKSFTARMYWVGFPLLRFRDTVQFEDGYIFSTLSVYGGYNKAPYTTRLEEGKLSFTGRAGRAENDYFDWNGYYDGERIHDVTMIWTKNNSIRTYKFKQDP